MQEYRRVDEEGKNWNVYIDLSKQIVFSRKELFCFPGIKSKRRQVTNGLCHPFIILKLIFFFETKYFGVYAFIFTKAKLEFLSKTRVDETSREWPTKARREDDGRLLL
ncbi:unnamed protein product [Microthlaspi erraticum]|uniref:Uncharacterized protein n=1 Tax=Microthlaspi erraticum TaxID=1685480 RepID=A0A6D2HMQ4_9BRAS|nr:unnamed protein product [Microthlaspi erraticum]